jgi:hypothetical protein
VGKSVSKKKIVAGQFAVKFNTETYYDCIAGLKNYTNKITGYTSTGTFPVRKSKHC